MCIKELNEELDALLSADRDEERYYCELYDVENREVTDFNDEVVFEEKDAAISEIRDRLDKDTNGLVLGMVYKQRIKDGVPNAERYPIYTISNKDKETTLQILKDTKSILRCCNEYV